MDEPENKCELVCESRSKKNLNVAYVYDIVRRILKTLDNSEIENCMKVCSLWKEIGESILRGRITIAVEDLPRDIIAITNFYPEYVLGFFKTQNGNINILTGYNGHSEENMERSDETKTIRLLLRLDARCQNEIKEKLKPGPTWFTELTDISKEETKCVLWIVDGILDDTFMKVIPQCAVSGISDISLCPAYRCIVFSGRMVHALSFNLPKDHTLQQMKVIELKQYNIAWNNCIVLFFNKSFMNWCNDRSNFSEIEIFSKEFPNIPILFYSGCIPFGVEYIPNIFENTSTIGECIINASVVAKIVILWIA
ncbi:uncharacterized protein LOC111641270 isoform X2 [Centruroides sculpturatus]|uniref:uncharacterized protein LOC111641270 isoform X2 n=1 Tax=Centruroides sculpturatus TaxID=218467 RepID=UPI000C6E3D80|nr:uncharacterized protein LOC111641270 isoform X2 [Centruroides sculpturatus]